MNALNYISFSFRQLDGQWAIYAWVFLWKNDERDLNYYARVLKISAWNFCPNQKNRVIMIRKKRVSFKEDLVERIPNSFSQGLETNEEVFITEFTQVFEFICQCSWTRRVQVEQLTYTHRNFGIFGFDIRKRCFLKLFPFVCRNFYLLFKPLSARLEWVMKRQINQIKSTENFNSVRKRLLSFGDHCTAGMLYVVSKL